MSNVPERPKSVLFLCTANSARSILAEALLNRLGEGRFRAFSAGSHPRGEINPHTVPIIESLGFAKHDFRSKSWDEFAAPGAPAIDFVITVCDSAAGEACPIWPGGPLRAHWGIPDPAAATGDGAVVAAAFRLAAERLRRRIGALLALPIDDADRERLRLRLNDIGIEAGRSEA